MVGGIEVIVLEESYNETGSKPRSDNARNENTETAAMPVAKTLGRFKRQKNRNDDFMVPEMPRPDVPRDIEEETLTETLKSYPENDTEQ